MNDNPNIIELEENPHLIHDMNTKLDRIIDALPVISDKADKALEKVTRLYWLGGTIITLLSIIGLYLGLAT